jgi:hypothetical protein
VGWDIDVDITALQAMLLKEPPIVLKNLVPVASLHEGVPQQQRKAVTVQNPSCATGRSQRCSTSNLSSETIFLED